MPDDPLTPIQPSVTPAPEYTPPIAPVTPMAPVTPVAPAFASPQPGVTSTGLAPNVAAGLALLFGIVSGIVFLALEKRDPLVRFWAMQSVVLNLAIIAFAIVASIMMAILGKIFLLGLLFGLALMVCYLGILAVYVISLIKAFSGKEWELPFIGKIARDQLTKYPPAP